MREALAPSLLIEHQLSVSSHKNTIYASRDRMEGHFGLDLQLAVLRTLPTPILVLSPSRTTIFANRALERILGFYDTIPTTGPEMVGQTPADLGVKLLYNRKWDVVLDKLASTQKLARVEGTTYLENDLVHEADAVLDNQTLGFEEKHFRVLISTITTEDGMHYVLSLERSFHAAKNLTPQGRDSCSPEEGISVTQNEQLRDSVIDPLKNIFRIKKAVFDSHSTMGFILTADEKFYLTNKKMREVIGDVMGGADGCDGPSMRSRFEIWDEMFARKLDATEFPGMKLVRAKKPFSDYRCGFVHAITGDRLTMNVSGECLYDDDTDEFLGGLCWCQDVQEYSDFLNDKKRRLLQSHETICDLMPHLVWTTANNGLIDWYSRRVSLKIKLVCLY